MSEEDHRHESEAQRDETHPTDEEQTETEWHLWLVAGLVIGGVLLVVVQSFDLQELGYVLIGLAVAGWILKTVVERSES